MPLDIDFIKLRVKLLPGDHSKGCRGRGRFHNSCHSEKQGKLHCILEGMAEKTNISNKMHMRFDDSDEMKRTCEPASKYLEVEYVEGG